MIDNRSVSKSDPEVYSAISRELERQQNGLELIASENLVSRAVLEATGSVLTNKYAEGYPRSRYYGGCECVDEVEDLARERATRLFGADFVNVQPHSGSQANMAVFRALANHGDTVMGMELAHGGHLTHGSPVNFSGQDFRIVSYGVDRDTEMIDYSTVRELAMKHKPRLIIAGGSAYSRTIEFENFRAIADEAGSLLITDMAHIAGLVAAQEHPSPIPHSHITTTTTHKSLRGPRGGMILIGKDILNDMGIVAPKSGRTKRIGELVNSNIFPGIQGGPFMHIIAAKAIALREALQPSFKEYQQKTRANARALAKALSNSGLRIVSGGTDNHLLVVDLTPLNINGRDAEKWLGMAGITVNRNAIPFDPLPPGVSSGIRLGTPSLTSRGMGEKEMEQVAHYIFEVLENGGESHKMGAILENVRNLCEQFPLYEYL